MPVVSKVYWFPERLNQKLLQAYKSSIRDARAAAIAQSHSPSKAGAIVKQRGPTSGLLIGTGLGSIFEGGREGGYVIQPGLRTTRSRIPGAHGLREASGVRAGSGNIALKFTKGDGGFARGGIIGGSMRAYPYIRPAAAEWARILYQRRASMALRNTIGVR